jgi:hypothetical protein
MKQTFLIIGTGNYVVLFLLSPTAQNRLTIDATAMKGLRSANTFTATLQNIWAGVFMMEYGLDQILPFPISTDTVKMYLKH